MMQLNTVNFTVFNCIIKNEFISVNQDFVTSVYSLGQLT